MGAHAATRPVDRQEAVRQGDYSGPLSGSRELLRPTRRAVSVNRSIGPRPSFISDEGRSHQLGQ